MQQKVTTPSQHLWLAKLMVYDFDIVYKRGRENRATDALSRMPSHEILCLAISAVSSDLSQQKMSSYEGDLRVQKIIRELVADSQAHSNYTWERGQRKRKGRLIVGRNAELKSQIVALFHSSRLGGHSEVHATYQRVSAILYWKGLWKIIREWVR